jgi:ribonuclease HI
MLPAPRYFAVNKRAANRISKINNTTKRFFRPGRWPVSTFVPGLDYYAVTVGRSTNNRREANHLVNALRRIKNRNYNAMHLYQIASFATRRNANTNFMNQLYNALISARMRPSSPSRRNSPPKRPRRNN